MITKPYISDIKQYLQSDKVIDYDNEFILKLSKELENSVKDKIGYIKAAYEYVRDTIGREGE